MAIITSILWTIEGNNTFENGNDFISTKIVIAGAGALVGDIDFVFGDTPSPSATAYRSLHFKKGAGFWDKDYALSWLYWSGAFTDTTTRKVYARITYVDNDMQTQTVYSSVNTINANYPLTVNTTVTSSRVDGRFFQDESSANISATVTKVPSRGANISSVIATVPAMSGYPAITKTLTLVGSSYTATIAANELPPGEVPITITATDVRGAVTTQTVTITVMAHSAPTISADVFRCDSGGDVDLSGEYLSATVYANSNPVELGLNSISMSGSFSQANMTSGQTYILGGSIDPDTAYSLVFTAEDVASTTSTLTITVPAVKRIIDIKDGGTGIAFGKKAEKDSVVDSKWPVYADGYFYSCEKDTEATSRGYAISFDEGQGSDGAAYMGRTSYTKDGVTHYDPARWIFSLYSRDSSTHERLAYPERYRLPIVDNDLTAEALYDILTTKNFLKVFSISSSSSKTFSLSNSSRGIFITTGSSANVKGAWIFNTTSSGSVTYTPILAATDLTLSKATRELTIANGNSSTTVFACFLIFGGSVD